MKKTQKIIFKDNLPVIEVRDIIQLSDCGYTFFTKRGNSDHHIYKLHKFNDRFYWIAVWNSCETIRGQQKNGFASILDAIKHMRPNPVYRNNISSIFNYHGLVELGINEIHN